MNCTQCGSALASGATFCGSCGAPSATVGATAVALSGSAPFGIDPLTQVPYSHRQKVTAGLLQIFLGGLGIGRFYTGHTGIAIAQIAVTLITCGLGGLWPLVDGVLMLTGKVKDVDGRPLRD